MKESAGDKLRELYLGAIEEKNSEVPEGPLRDYHYNVDGSAINMSESVANFYILSAIVEGSLIPSEVVTMNLNLPTDKDVKDAGALLGLDEDVIGSRVIHFEQLRMISPETLFGEHVKAADVIFKSLVESLDELFILYSLFACGGELRHAPTIERKIERHISWNFCNDILIPEMEGPENFLEAAIEIFNEPHWDSAFGGEAWALCTEVCLNRLRGKLGPEEFSNKAVFVDRVFSLQHNTGTFLNKLFIGLGNLGEVLDLHDNSLIGPLTSYCSQDIQEMMGEYKAIAETNSITLLLDGAV